MVRVPRITPGKRIGVGSIRIGNEVPGTSSPLEGCARNQSNGTDETRPELNDTGMLLRFVTFTTRGPRTSRPAMLVKIRPVGLISRPGLLPLGRMFNTTDTI